MGSIDTASKLNDGTDSVVKKQPDSRLSVTALTLMLVASVALNVMLALKVRELTGAQNAARAERELKVGTIVPPITAKRFEGSSETIIYAGDSRPTVLYIFTPQCGWCERNLDNLQTLISQKGEEYRFVGISLSDDGLGEYMAVHHLTFPIYTDIPKEVGEAYKMGGTPQTVVVSPQAQVIRNWVGAYAGNQKSEVEAYFHLTLPGLRPGISD